MASLGYGLGLGRFFPLTVFSFSAPFVSRVIAFIYDERFRGLPGLWFGVGPVLAIDCFFSFSYFCFSGYSVHLRCMSEGGSLVSVCCPAVLLSLLSGLYRVHGLHVSSLCHAAR